MKGKVFKQQIFNSIVEGRVTQFAEIVRANIIEVHNENTKAMQVKTDGGILMIPKFKFSDMVYLKEPFRLKLREHHLKWYKDGNLGNGHYDIIYGDSTEKEVYLFRREVNKITKSQLKSGHNAGASHMIYKRMARYFIEITAVKCERIQSVSDEDCSREGIEEVCGGMNNNGVLNAIEPNYQYLYTNGFDAHNSQKEAYAALIDIIHGKGTWDKNPYVFRYEFELIKK